MIEPIMYVGIGFLVAGLLVIGLIPMVHARAVRLTQRRLEAMTPLSMAEIQADKDQLRAEFAMSTRRLEMSVEQVKAKSTTQLAEIGKKSEAVARLKLELAEKSAAMMELEARDKALVEELQTTTSDLEARTSALQETERKLAEISAEMNRITSNRDDVTMTAESQRVELGALRTQADVFKKQIDSYANETRELQAKLERETAERGKAERLLADERSKVENLGSHIGELERRLVTQTSEAEVLNRRSKELAIKLEQQSAFLAERQAAAEQLHEQIKTSQQTETSVRGAMTEIEHRTRIAVETLRSEKAMVEDALKQAQAERDQAQRELAALRSEQEKVRAAESNENGVLRERINEVAAEIARLTSALEGPASPIEAILSGDSSRNHSGLNGIVDKRLGTLAAGEGSNGSLADRIRALQARTQRAQRAV
jgi:hypothetical protein